MKPFIPIFLFAFAITSLVVIPNNTCAQAPPPPSGGHGQSSNQNGGSAPLGSGLAILLTLGAGYGAYKYKTTKEE